MINRTWWVAVATAVLSTAGCGADPAEEQRSAADELDKAQKNLERTLDEGGKNIEQAVNDLEKALGTALSDDVKSVDHRDLKGLLPEKIGDMERVGVSGEKSGAFGFNVTTANGDYEAEDGKSRLSLSITDIGKMGTFASMGLEYADAEIDREDRDGFERTTVYKGYRAKQKMTRLGENASLSEMTVFVEDRFVVQIDAENAEWETVEDAIAAIDLKELVSLL